MSINLNDYSNFVNKCTSDQSNNTDSFIDSFNKVGQNCNPSLLLTSVIGISAEAGELSEIVKKCFFQGKELNDDSIFHCKRELGDVFWYWINCCRALNLDPYSVIEENIVKLEKRYPNGFSEFNSENRKAGDI